jgi:hypothetical protein
MKLALFLYLTDLVGNIDTITSICFIIYGGLALIGGFAFCITTDSWMREEHECVKELLKRLTSKWWIFPIALSISVVLPTKRTMHLMLGSVYLSNSNLPSKVSQALELKLDDIIDELKHDKKG